MDEVGRVREVLARDYADAVGDVIVDEHTIRLSLATAKRRIGERRMDAAPVAAQQIADAIEEGKRT